MTREEIINEIKCILSELDSGVDAVSYLTQNDVKWLNENIKALEQEPTTKDEHHRQNIQAYAHDFGVSEEQAEKELRVTTKNDLGVDCISREKVLKLIYDYKENHSNDREHYPINYGTLIDMIRWVRNLPSVTPQEPFIKGM